MSVVGDGVPKAMRQSIKDFQRSKTNALRKFFKGELQGNWNTSEIGKQWKEYDMNFN